MAEKNAAQNRRNRKNCAYPRRPASSLTHIRPRYVLLLSSPRGCSPAINSRAPGIRQRTAPWPTRASTSTNTTPIHCNAASWPACFPNSARVPVHPAPKTTASSRRAQIAAPGSRPASILRSTLLAKCAVAISSRPTRQTLAPHVQSRAPLRSAQFPAPFAPDAPSPPRQSLRPQAETPSAEAQSAAETRASQITDKSMAAPETAPPLSSTFRLSTRPKSPLLPRCIIRSIVSAPLQSSRQARRLAPRIKRARISLARIHRCPANTAARRLHQTNGIATAGLRARGTMRHSQRIAREFLALYPLHIHRSCPLAIPARKKTAENESRCAPPQDATALAARTDARDPARQGHKAQKSPRTPRPDEALQAPRRKSAIASACSSPRTLRSNPWVGPVQQQIRHEISRHKKQGRQQHAPNPHIQVPR